MTGRDPELGACRCCNGSRRVPDIRGELRPCSRCDVDGFEAWSRANRPQIPAVCPAAPGEPPAKV